MSKFERRHYKAVAETIRDMYMHDPAIDHHIAGLIMSRFTLMFKWDNYAFKPSRFEEACGLADWQSKHKEAAE